MINYSKQFKYSENLDKGEKFMKKKLLVGTLLAGSVLLAACSGGFDNGQSLDGIQAVASGENVYNLVVEQEMPTADPSLATDAISFAALNNIYEGLYRLNEKDEPIPAGAAELANVSDDGLVYTIKLREDAKWSNGDPVTANDYVYGWQRTIDPATQSEYAYLYEPVKNAQAILDETASPEELGIKALNDHELEITLEKPVAYFDYLLAFPSFFPQNQAIAEEFGKDYTTKSEYSVYNGPFVLEDFSGPGSDTTWTYQKNPEYWDAENVALDLINVSVIKEPSTALNLFNDGQADDVILSGELAQQNANNPAYYSATEARTSYIEFNQRDADSPYNNANLRKAISYSIDREALVTQVLKNGSVPSTGLIPVNLSANPSTGEDFAKESGEWVSYDPDEAKKSWELAKKELGIDSITIEFLSSDDESTKKVITYIQSCVESTLDGVKVNLAPVPFSVRLDRSSAGDFDMVLGGWAADYLDPSSFTDLFITESSYNRGHWSNTDYDSVVNASQTIDANDSNARWQDFLDAQTILMEEMGVVPVFQKAEAHLINEQFQGVVHHSAGASWDYKWVTVTQ